MSLIFSTPEDLVNTIISIETNIDDLKDIKTILNALSFRYGIRFKNHSTGPSRNFQYYSCSMDKTIYNCKSRVVFSIFNGKIKFEKANWDHSHDFRSFQKEKKFMLSPSQIKSIQDATMNGMSAGRIRIMEQLTCGSDLLYEIRRPILRAIKSNEIDRLIRISKEFKDYQYEIMTNENNEFNGAYYFPVRITKSNYANDICIVDDTVCTNNFNKPLIVSLAVDQNSLTQVTGFGLMIKKEKIDFIKYFQKLKANIGNDIRLFITDRSYAQVAAMKEVFPNARIIFCFLHLKRNLVHAFETNHICESLVTFNC